MGAAAGIDVEACLRQFLGESVPPEALSTPLPDEVAADLVERLKQQADRYWGIDPNQSLEFARRILAIGQARGDARQTALGLMATGDALKFLGRTQEAWQTLDEAGEMYRAAGDEIGWGRTRIGRLYLSTMLNRVPEALAEAETARDIFLHSGELEKLLRLDFQVAFVYDYLGNQFKALEHYQLALNTAQGMGDAAQQHLGPLFTNIGNSYEELGDYRQAQEYYERAYGLFEARGDTLHLTTLESNMGYLAQAQGNYRIALRLLNRAMARVAGKFDVEATQIKWHLLDCYLGLNRHTEALDMAEQVVADYRQFNDSFKLGRALLKLATIEAELAKLDAAQKALDEVEDIFTGLGATTWRAIAWLRRGRIALKQGDPETAYQKAAAATPLFESAGQQVNTAEATMLRGQALFARRDFKAAAEEGAAVLWAAQRYNIPSLRYTAHLLLGRINEQQSALTRAVRHYWAAAVTTERVQRGLTITLQPGFLEDKAEAWRALIRLNLAEGRPGRAIEILERAKSQVLLGYLANREQLRWAQNDAYSHALIEELDQLRAGHQWFYRLANDTNPNLDPAGEVQRRQALIEVAARERRMRSITEELYLYSVEGHREGAVVMPPVEAIQHTLDLDTLMIEFYNDGEQWWAFTLDQATIDVYRLPVTVAELNSLAAQLQVNLAGALKMGYQAQSINNLTRLVQRILKKLYTSLIEPLAYHLEGRERLVFVPYGPLHLLPFHLLFDGTAYLIERYEVVILPAASLATQRGPRRKPGARVLAHSWEGRLPNTSAEAQIVLGLFGGELRTEEAADRTVFQAEPLQILHIAAHGQYRLDQPDLSFIQLADGQTYADDLLQQDLSYELVTLSACETGRANIAAGDELIGLGRGFLYSGAGALVLSLWPVSDALTAHWMENMYQALKRGVSKAAAVREAQRKALAEEAGLHPAYWGAFQLIGDASPFSSGWIN